MAKREISIVLRAKNAMAAGLSKAKEDLKSFGQSAARIGKAFTVAFLAAGTALAGFAAKALSAYSKQELAEKAAADALRAHGEEVENNLAAIRRYASAIQDETGAADESTIAMMARLRLLGVETNALDQAAKAVIALKSAGMQEEAAMKAVAMARAGNFEMLSRYIPALRTATSETEKAQIVNDFLAKGYEQQKGQLNTVAGQWNALKGRIGDVWEEVGKAIAQNAGLVGILQKAGDAVKAFGQRISEWVAGPGLANAIATYQHFFETLRHGLNKSSNAAHIAFSAIGDGFATVGKYLGNIAKAIIGGLVNQFKTASDVVVASIRFIKKPTRENFAAIGEAGKEAAKAIADTYINTAKAIATQTGIVSKRTEAALAQRQQYENEHAERVEAINQAHIERLNALNEKRKDDSVSVIQEIEKAEKASIDELTKAREDAANKIADLEKEGVDKEKQEREKALNDEIAGLEKIKKEREELAAKRVADIIAEAKAGKDLQKELAKEGKRAEELRARKARGAKLSKRQEEWLAAFDKIQAAQKGIKKDDPIMQQLDVAKQNLDQLKIEHRTMTDILKELQAANAAQKQLDQDLTALLRMA